MYGKAPQADPDDAPVVSKEAETISLLKEELHNIYIGIDVKVTSDKELVIQFAGDEEYFRSVQKDLEGITDKVMKTSAIGDYPIIFQRFDFVDEK